MQKGILCTVAPKYHLNTCAPFVSNTLMNGYQPERSGDVIYSLAPGWIDWSSPRGSSHGTLYDYDAHVPLIFHPYQIKVHEHHNRKVFRVNFPWVMTSLSSRVPENK